MAPTPEQRPNLPTNEAAFKYGLELANRLAECYHPEEPGFHEADTDRLAKLVYTVAGVELLFALTGFEAGIECFKPESMEVDEVRDQLLPLFSEDKEPLTGYRLHSRLREIALGSLAIGGLAVAVTETVKAVIVSGTELAMRASGLESGPSQAPGMLLKGLAAFGVAATADFLKRRSVLRNE